MGSASIGAVSCSSTRLNLDQADLNPPDPIWASTLILSRSTLISYNLSTQSLIHSSPYIYGSAILCHTDERYASLSLNLPRTELAFQRKGPVSVLDRREVVSPCSLGLASGAAPP